MVNESEILWGAAEGISTRLSSFLCVLATAFMLTSLGAPRPGLAQTDVDMPESATDDAALPSVVEEIVVTGSRITRTGFTAPTPVTTLSEEQMEAYAPTNVGDVLTQLPSVRATNTPQTSGVTSAGGGLFLADLRGLGAGRTLVLLDGRRFVPSTTTGQVDLNQIPVLLVQRAEVVTGGASAAWGSDAVAGVANLILKDKLQGVQAVSQYGQAERGDNESYRVSLGGGTSFANGRGHFLFGGDWADTRGVGDQYTRDWGRDEFGIITNSDFANNGLPNFIISPDVRQSHVLYSGGVILSGPLQGVAFRPDGTPFQLQFGEVFGNEMIGGDGFGEARPVGTNLATPVERFNVLTRTSYEVSPSFNLVGELSYAQTQVGGQSGQPRDTGTRSLTIQQDNAFLPESVRQAMVNQGLPSIQVGRQNLDFGHAGLNLNIETIRVAIGADGNLPDGWYGDNWQWDAYAQYGENTRTNKFFPNRHQANWRRSIDAVLDPATGTVVCRSTLTDPGNGCIPTNIFGNGNALPNDYTAVESWARIITEQEVYAVNLQGDPLSTWAGPVSVAFGSEHRRERANRRSDPLQQVVNPNDTVGALNTGNVQPFSGSYNVQEFYSEIIAPLATEQAWADRLEANAAVRLTDYSTSGVVTTWKLGLSYAPYSDLRFRVTRSRDIRAPNIEELFGPRQQGGLTTIPNRAGVSQQVLRLGGGNPDLEPEEAETWTAGGIYEPAWLPGFSFSLDWFDITIDEVISTLGHAEVARQCFSGIEELCQHVQEDDAGNMIFVVSPTFNLDSFETRGIDLEVVYRNDLDTFIPGAPGDIGVRFLATYVDRLTETNAAGSFDRVGKLSNNGDGRGVPDWRWNGNLTYNLDRLTVDLQGRYVSSGVFNPLFTEGAGAALTINNNHVPSKFYVNLGGQYRFGQGGLEVFARVSNLFDVDPAMVPSGGLGGVNSSSIDSAFHDAIGRSYTVGARLSF